MADYFNYGDRRRGSPVTQSRLNAPLPPGGGPIQRQTSRGTRPRQPSSIRIRRLPSGTVQSSRPASQGSDEVATGESSGAEVTARQRSSSAPQRYGTHLDIPGTDLSRQRTTEPPQMQTITEGAPLQEQVETPYHDAESPRPLTPSIRVQTPDGQDPVSRVATGASAVSAAGSTAQRARGARRLRSSSITAAARNQPALDEYDHDVVDLLDLVDPEVRTIGTLNNIQNSLFVPDLGGLINRRPTYDLTYRSADLEQKPRSRAGTKTGARPEVDQLPTIPQAQSPDIELQSPRQKRTSISSNMSDSHYAVLPHGVSLEDWTDEDIAELNDHVRHLLHSKREGFKRGMRGFRKYLSKPLGLFVFVYAVLVTLFGAAWVFCLIGWIYVGSKQDYFINVIDNILVALFALIGDGMAPFRAVDTYHMCFIAHYHHLTWQLRQKKELPNLVDENDLPDRRVSRQEIDEVVDKEETAEFSVLSPRQQRRLQYHQAKFSKAHTFYKPHETSTHHAFPLRLLVAVVVLLDCHTLFQVALGTCTWSINYRIRPQSLTATILSLSITCNITAGVIISIGDHRTRKKDVLERMFRQNLTEQAIRHVQKKYEQDTSVGIEQDMTATDVDKTVDAGGPSILPNHKSDT